MSREKVYKIRGRRFINPKQFNLEQSERVGTRNYMALTGQDDFDWTDTEIDPGTVGSVRNRSNERRVIPHPIKLP